MDEYTYFLNNIGEYGVVKEVRLPIVVVQGLPHARPHELVIFDNGQRGEIFIVDNTTVEILMLAKSQIKVGSKVVRTNQSLNVPVGKELLGKIVDTLGNPIVGGDQFVTPKERRQLDRRPPGIVARTRINKSLHTGVSVVDMMVPLGKGQRELVIGDRKTGKSSFLLSLIKNQIKEGGIAIYAGIARKKSDVKLLHEYLEKEGLAQSVVIVASFSDDSPSVIFRTPYTGMTLAEYFAEQGQDILLVLDDLSSHAKFYREISLLGKRFPGRDSYPGDIFYVHAKLLERAGNFIHPTKGEVSITCIPVVETTEGDISGYISTNIMSMTDGHIFFDSELYYKGTRPAINTSLSVTRVGRQTQSSLQREISQELNKLFSNYERVENFMHFGSELSGDAKLIIQTGEKVMTLFEQHYSLTVPSEVQLVLIGLIWARFFDSMSIEQLKYARDRMSESYYADPNARTVLQSVASANNLNNLVNGAMSRSAEIFTACRING